MPEYIKGLVSVIIPTYKRSEKLDRAIDSVLNQTYKDLELILVNDNEPDDEYTKELKNRLKKYEADPRFIFVIQDKHINGAAARNAGIEKAKGEFIAFLDDDDWWEKEKLEKQVAVLEKLPAEWGGVTCRYSFINGQGAVIGKSHKYKDGKILNDILNLITDVTTCSLVLRHSALDKTGYFDQDLLRHQDFQLLVNFTYTYKLKLVDDFLLNIDVSDAQNRPDGNKLLKYKESFFKSIKPIMSKLTLSEQKCILCMHNYELAYIFLKNKDIKNALKYGFTVFTSPKALYLAIKKTLIKLCTILKR